MLKYLTAPAILLILGFGFIHHQVMSNIKLGQGRAVASEKPISFDHLNTYKALTKSSPLPGPLFLAVMKNQLSQLKAFVENGHDINQLNDKRQNLLIVAVELGHQDIFNYLMTLKFDLDHQDIYGMTALMYAAEKDQMKMLKPMLKKEHDLTILSAKEKSTYDYAKETESFAALKLLEKWEAPCNTSCDLGAQETVNF